jgi:hypothetical protein
VYADGVAVLEPGLCRRLVSRDVTAVGIHEHDGLGVERVLAAVHVDQPLQLHVAPDAEERIGGGLAVNRDVDEGAVATRVGLHLHRL